MKKTTNLQVAGAEGSGFLYVPKAWMQIFDYKKGQKFNTMIHKNGDITFTPAKRGK